MRLEGGDGEDSHLVCLEVWRFDLMVLEIYISRDASLPASKHSAKEGGRIYFWDLALILFSPILICTRAASASPPRRLARECILGTFARSVWFVVVAALSGRRGGRMAAIPCIHFRNSSIIGPVTATNDILGHF